MRAARPVPPARALGCQYWNGWGRGGKKGVFDIMYAYTCVKVDYLNVVKPELTTPINTMIIVWTMART